MPPSETTNAEKSSRSYWGFVLWPLAVLLLSATSLTAADAVTNAVPKVAVTNLLAHGKEYNGKKVEVTGYYRRGFELSAMWDKQEDAKKLHIPMSIWVGRSVKQGYESKIKLIKEGMVRIVGVFHYGGEKPEQGVGHLARIFHA
jgi:hypothetical protein